MEKNIEDYLHLYLGCRIQNLQGGFMDLTTARLGYILEHESPENYKPILRPLSDMTEDEATEIWTILDWNDMVKPEHRAVDII